MDQNNLWNFSGMTFQKFGLAYLSRLPDFDPGNQRRLSRTEKAFPIKAMKK